MLFLCVFSWFFYSLTTSTVRDISHITSSYHFGLDNGCTFNREKVLFGDNNYYLDE